MQYVDKTAGDEACGYKQWFTDTIGKLPKGPNYLVSIDSGEAVAGRLGLVDKVIVEPVLGRPSKARFASVWEICTRSWHKLTAMEVFAGPDGSWPARLDVSLG